MKRTIILISALAITAVTVSTCGIKPGSVDSPNGVEHDAYPRTYPSSNTLPSTKD